MAIFDEPSRKPLPQTTFEDVKHAGRKGLVSMIPFVGGAGSELLGLLSSPVAERRDDWFADLERRLQELEGRVAGFKFDDLAHNQQFVSATLQATQAALRTHDQKKLEALRNAVLNAALGHGGDDDRRATFLSLIDRLQPAHLRILETFQRPPARGIYNQWGPITIQNPGTPTRWVKEFVPGLKDEDADFIRMLITDLYNAGLVFIAPGAQNMPIDSRLITDLGTSFLNFIREPSK